MKTRQEIELKLKEINKNIAEIRKFFKTELLNRYDIDELNEEILNDLIKYEKDLTLMFDSDVRIAMALLEKIRNIKQKELNQNKDE